MSDAIVQMERVTQTNAATAEESAAASEELSAQDEATMEIIHRLEQWSAATVRRPGARGAGREHVRARRQSSTSPHAEPRECLRLRARNRHPRTKARRPRRPARSAISNPDCVLVAFSAAGTHTLRASYDAPPAGPVAGSVQEPARAVGTRRVRLPARQGLCPLGRIRARVERIERGVMSDQKVRSRFVRCLL